MRAAVLFEQDTFGAAISQVKGIHLDCSQTRSSVNAPTPMSVTLSGIVTLVEPVQPENAKFPMVMTPLGIVTLVRPAQPSKHRVPILVTLSGIVTLVKPCTKRTTRARCRLWC